MRAHISKALVWIVGSSAAGALALVALNGDGADRYFSQESIHAPLVRGLYGSRSVQIEPHGGPISPVSLPIDEPGDIAWRGDDLLFCGFDALQSRTVLALVTPDGFGVYSLADTYTDSTSNFVGVAYDDETELLYLLDCDGERILAARFSSSQSTLPTSFAVLANRTQIPELAGREDYKLVVDPRGGVTQLVLTHAFVPESEEEVRIDLGSLQASSTRAPRAGIADPRLSVGQTSVSVVGPASSIVLLVRMSDSSVVGVGVTDAQGDADIAVPPLVSGEIYAARELWHPDPGAPFLSPASFVGVADSFNGGASFVPLSSHTSQRLIVGNPHFTISVNVHDPARAYAGINLPAVLVLSTPSQIVMSGNRAVLQPGSIFPAAVAFPDLSVDPLPPSQGMDVHGYGEVHIPIPDIPAIAGIELAFQWYVQDTTGDVLVSEVVHTPIRAERYIAPGTESLFP